MVTASATGSWRASLIRNPCPSTSALSGFITCSQGGGRSENGKIGDPACVGLIREMSVVNRLSGAPRIHGELLKLGIDVGTPIPRAVQTVGQTPCRAQRRRCRLF
jgi:hypothetical protein